MTAQLHLKKAEIVLVITRRQLTARQENVVSTGRALKYDGFASCPLK